MQYTERKKNQKIPLLGILSRGEIVHHRHGTKRVPSNGKSEHMSNNRQKKIEVLLPEAGMIEKEKK
jgi:hypothetical protein